MTTFGDLRSWRAAGLEAASAELRRDLKKLERARDELEAKAIPDSWSGLSRVVAVARKSALVATMTAHLDGVRTFERAVYSAIAAVRAIGTEVDDIDADARAGDFEVGADGSVSDVSVPPTFHHRFEAEEWRSTRVHGQQLLVTRVEKVLQQAYDVDRALVQARPRDSFSSEGPKGVADPEVADDWARMSDAERRTALANMARELAERYGIEDYEMVIDDLEDQDGDGVDDDPASDLHGYWSESDKEMHLDSTELADPDIINTLAHEMRHAAQHENIRDADPGLVDRGLINAGLKDDPFNPPPGVTRDDVEEWERNFEDYQTADDDGWDAYLDQPVERDARESGEEYVETLTPEELESHRGGR